MIDSSSQHRKEIEFHGIGTGFVILLFRTGFCPKWQNFVEFQTKSWHESFQRTNCLRKVVTWKNYKLTFFKLNLVSLLTKDKLTQVTCICLRGKAPQTFTGKLIQFHFHQEWNQIQLEKSQFVIISNHSFSETICCLKTFISTFCLEFN